MLLDGFLNILILRLQNIIIIRVKAVVDMDHANLSHHFRSSFFAKFLFFKVIRKGNVNGPQT